MFVDQSGIGGERINIVGVCYHNGAELREVMLVMCLRLHKVH